MKKLILVFLLLPFLSFSQIISHYPNMVGDITFDSTLDKKDFQLCFSKHIFQYFNNSGGLEYEGEKLAIEKAFKLNYNPKLAKLETGSIRIRFIVNCKGETDRFRLIGMDNNYEEKQFDKSITEQLLNITKNLKGWKPKRISDVNHEIDYYQYLIFKIENGQIKEILP